MIAFEGIGPDVVAPVLVFSIPILAIVGGITAGIVKHLSRARLIELAQRERIAMIEHDMDPTKLPPLPSMGDLDVGVSDSPAEAARRRSQGLMIGGLVSLAVGIGLGIMLYYIADENGVWAVGSIPAAIGVALLLSAFLIRPKDGN